MVDPSEIAGEIIDAVFEPIKPPEPAKPDRREVCSAEIKGCMSFLLILWFTTGLGLSLLVFFVWAMRYAWIHAG